MSDDAKKPDPFDDAKKGLSLLFRAAKSVAARVPKDGLEGTMRAGVKEVGRAMGNVAHTIERQVSQWDVGGRARPPSSPPPSAPDAGPAAPAPDGPDARPNAKDGAKDGAKTDAEGDGPPGPRVAPASSPADPAREG